MPSQKKDNRITVKCPACGRELDGRGFKNHMYNEHDATKTQAAEAWLAATGRNPISWKAMQKQQPYIHRTDVPPLDPESTPTDGSWQKAFKEGYEAGLNKGIELAKKI